MSSITRWIWGPTQETKVSSLNENRNEHEVLDNARHHAAGDAIHDNDNVNQVDEGEDGFLDDYEDNEDDDGINDDDQENDEEDGFLDDYEDNEDDDGINDDDQENDEEDGFLDDYEDNEDDDGINDDDQENDEEADVYDGRHESEGEVVCYDDARMNEIESEDENMEHHENPAQVEVKESNSSLPSKDPLKYGCLVCKDNDVYNYRTPSFHNSVTGAYVCDKCIRRSGEMKAWKPLEEMRKAAREEGEIIDLESAIVATGREYWRRYEEKEEKKKMWGEMKKKWRWAEEKGLWSLLLSSDISSRPLASQGIEAYSLYRLQTIKDNPVKPPPEGENNRCPCRCSCPHRKAEGENYKTDSYSKYPPCRVCHDSIMNIVRDYADSHDDCDPECGDLYCVYCCVFVCHLHADHIDSYPNVHRHSRQWIISYEEAFDYLHGRIPKYDVCWRHESIPYVYIDMSILKPICEKCCDESPDNDYLHFKKANAVIRDRIATALTAMINKKACSIVAGQALDTTTVTTSSSSFSSSSSSSSSSCSSSFSDRARQAALTSQKELEQAFSADQLPTCSIPELIHLFKDVEVPLFELLQVLSEIDDIIRRMLPVTKVKKEKRVESKALRKRIRVKVDKYKTPLDEQADTCRRLWGEVSNDLINRVEVYAKSRFGIGRSLEHCLESLNVSSLLMPNESTESKQEVTGTQVSDRTGRRQGGIVPKKEVSKGPERASRRKKVVTKDDILNVLNQVPLTKERVSEELMYLTTIECLRETIEYGDPHFFILTKAKVESIATRLKPTLLQLKKQVLALEGRWTFDISFVNELTTVISQYSTSLKEAGKVEAWLSV